MDKLDLILITTGKERALLDRLIDSIQGKSMGLNLLMVLVNQGPEFEFASQDEQLKLHTINVGEQLSLSAARNMALNWVFNQKLSGKYVLFPDDDSTFDQSYFQNIRQYLKEPRLLLAKIVNQEDQGDYRRYPSKPVRGTLSLLPYVSSVGLIIPFGLAQKVGFFDPTLGVGAKWGSSEDLDYYLRCCAYGDFEFNPALYSFHPSRFGKYRQLSAAQISQRFKAYTDGYLLVHYRYKLESNLRSFATRAIAGSLLSILKGEFTLARSYYELFLYRRKMKAYFGELRASNPKALGLKK